MVSAADVVEACAAALFESQYRRTKWADAAADIRQMILRDTLAVIRALAAQTDDERLRAMLTTLANGYEREVG